MTDTGWINDYPNGFDAWYELKESLWKTHVQVDRLEQSTDSESGF